MVAATCLVLAGIVWAALPWLRSALEPQLVDWVGARLSETERRALLEQASREIGYMWEAVPEPRVGRLGKRDVMLERRQAEVRLNNAGLRSERAFQPRRPRRFRIVCLGDSVVFGEAGREQDRFCNQLQAFYRKRGITADGRKVETYAVGLTSWTAVQQATYLSSRLTEYDPDVVLVLSVDNDISDNSGVTGGGVTTRDWSPEQRGWGSATFTDRAALGFGNPRLTAIVTGLGPESRARWRAAMAALPRLVRLQERAGGRTLLSVWRQDSAFTERYKRFAALEGIDAPLLLTDYFPADAANRLPHDSHPSRAGHAILAAHYVHALDALGWVDTPDDQLPPLDPRLSRATAHLPDEARIRDADGAWIERILRSELVFGRLAPEETSAFLGGLLPDVGAPQAGAAPWASVRAGWLMRSRGGSGSLALEIEVPRRVELFPFRLEVRINGAKAEVLELEDVDAAGSHTIRVPAPGLDHDERVVEVMLETESYFTGIEDPRMKSFRLLSARID